MNRVLTLLAAVAGLAATGCAGAEIDKEAFSKVDRVVIGCLKGAPQGVGDQLAMSKVGSATADAANAALGLAIREVLEEWGEFRVIPADEAAATGTYKALGTSARGGYTSHGGTYLLAANNAAVIADLFEDTEADAMIFADWTWHLQLPPGQSTLRYSVQVRLAMVKPDGTRIWFGRSKAGGEFTDAGSTDAEYVLIVPIAAGNLISDAMDALSSPE